MSQNPPSFNSRYRAMEAHLRQKGLLDQLDQLPPDEDMRFLDDKSFRIAGITHTYSVVMEVGRSFGLNWAAANGDIIQEQAGPLGTTKFWTRDSGLILYAPAPFDTPGIREGLATPMAPETLALIRFYLVQYIRRRNKKDQTLAFPDLEDLSKALRKALHSPRQKQESFTLNTRVGTSNSYQGGIPPAPLSALNMASRGLVEVGRAPLDHPPPSSNNGTSRSFNSLFENPAKATPQTSNTVAQWQVSHTENCSDPDTGNSAGNGIKFASWMSIARRISQTLLSHLPPIDKIDILPLSRHGFVRLQIRLGVVEGRPLHACFKLTANTTISPSFWVLICGAKLINQPFGDAWTKVDFGELEDIVQSEPSKIQWPFSAAGTQEELKVLCKWYFILAAESKVHDFEDKLFPMNDTLVDHLTKACKRIKATKDDDMVDYDDEVSSFNGDAQTSNSLERFSTATTLVGRSSPDSCAEFTSHRSAPPSDSSTTATATPQTKPRLRLNLLSEKRSKTQDEVRKHPARPPTTSSKRGPRKETYDNSSPMSPSRRVKKTRKQSGTARRRSSGRKVRIASLQSEWNREQERLQMSKEEQTASQMRLNEIHGELIGLLGGQSMEQIDCSETEESY
ncbi:hypothetical protein BKA63DRAFT_566030 [Paraphoma chrysanthemicola]|nr:hypothetical protein BKA63DRAFT_566030 [Paraphoma chrysanthemicola]